jgi:hypothetical protein
MLSSIFNFDLPRAALRWPVGRHLRHLALLAAFAATYAACLALLSAVFGATRPETTRTLGVKALSPKTEVLFLGNSVVEAAINSKRFDRPAMALPMANGNYEIDEMILNRHLPNLPSLRAVVLQVDITCLGWDRLGITLDFSAFLELGIPIQDTPRPAWWKLRQGLIEHPAVFPMLFGERLTPVQLIWAPRYGALNTRPEPGYARLIGVLDENTRAEYFAKPAEQEPLNPSIIAKNRDSFSRICQKLQSKGIQVAVLRYPSRGGYSIFQSAEWKKVLSDFQRDLGKLAGPNAVVIDLADDPRFETSDFRDTVHLNFRGADKLAAILNESLKNLLEGAP